MRSSSGEHFVALDHVRAVAALLVFTWHFSHGTLGHPIPFDYTPAVAPFTLLDEGHTGVALFMTLSGYLFAKLLDGRSVDYPKFVWNRVLRLLPLLVVVIVLEGIRLVWYGRDLESYFWLVAGGVVRPTLPNGGWSITTEFHFYLILPVLLWMGRRFRPSLVAVVLVAIALRAAIYLVRGQVQFLAYFSILGRIDQFTLGILAFQLRSLVKGRHLATGLGLSVFLAWAYAINLRHGGFFPQGISVQSKSPIWIVAPTFEALAYGLAIAYYDSTFSPKNQGISYFIGRLGAYSYSIYLLHFFVVFKLARTIDTWFPITNFYVACAWALVFFALMLPVGALSFRYIEGPFLKLRKPYLLPRDAERAPAPASVSG